MTVKFTEIFKYDEYREGLVVLRLHISRTGSWTTCHWHNGKRLFFIYITLTLFNCDTTLLIDFEGK